MSLNPATPESVLEYVLDKVDLILVMSVNPGFGGQSFMPEALDKIKALRDYGYKGEIEVDGGVNADNIKSVAEAGCDIAVVGSFLMKKPAKDRTQILKELQAA